MGQYIAIDHTIPDHHKHQEFDTPAEAQEHISSGKLPNGFATVNPGGDPKFWVVDLENKTVTFDAEGSESFLSAELVAQINSHATNLILSQYNEVDQRNMLGKATELSRKEAKNTITPEEEITLAWLESAWLWIEEVRAAAKQLREELAEDWETSVIWPPNPV